MSSLDTARARGPFVVAHRAGNDLRSLRRAESARVAVVEADLSLSGGRVAAALRARERPATVCCSQNWALLTGIGAVAGVRLVHSVGSARQLAALHKVTTIRPLAGISIHKKLLICQQYETVSLGPADVTGEAA